LTRSGVDTSTLPLVIPTWFKTMDGSAFLGLFIVFRSASPVIDVRNATHARSTNRSTRGRQRGAFDSKKNEQQQHFESMRPPDANTSSCTRFDL
jgi:hypothetical protein